jgi:hypothetical protein
VGHSHCVNLSTGFVICAGRSMRDLRAAQAMEKQSVKCLVTALAVLTLADGASADGWDYSRNENLMTSEVTDTFARLENPSPPYGAIIVANRKEGGIDASVAFSAARVDCPKACQILVRADDTAPQTFGVTNSVNQLYFRDSAAFIEYIRNAKRVRLQFRFENLPHNQFKGEVVSTFYADAPLVVHPLRKGVAQ